MFKPDVLAGVATDPEIIARIKAGEKDYFEILIRRYNGALYKVGRSYGMPHADVEDLMQETHIAAFLNLGKFEERSAYKTWLIRIMLNKCYHFMQKKSQQNKAVFSEASTTGAVFTPETIAFSGFHTNERTINSDLLV